MAEYILNLSATSNVTPNTFDQYIELKAATSTTILLKRCEVSFTTTTPQDQTAQIKILRNSAAGTATSGLTPTPAKLRQNSPASTATVVTKNGTNAFTTGANVDTPKFDGVNTRSFFLWIAADQEEWIESTVAGYIAIAVAISIASMIVNVTLVWEE